MHFIRQLFSLLIILPLVACAEKSDTHTTSADFNPNAYTAGKEYDEITPAIRTRDPKKIEVVEFFWYGCGHCNALEPHLVEWKKTLGNDIDFYAIPATFQNVHKMHARIFYTTESLGIQEKIHPLVYDEIHKNNNSLANKDMIKTFLMKQGVSEEDFNNTFESFGVESSIKQANSKSLTYGITGIPTIIVNGKYRTSASMAGGEKELFDVVNFLIEKERRAKQ